MYYFRESACAQVGERARGKAEILLSEEPDMGLAPMPLNQNQEMNTQLTKPPRCLNNYEFRGEFVKYFGKVNIHTVFWFLYID